MNNKKLFNYFSTKFKLKTSSNGWYRLDSPFGMKKGTMAVNFTQNRVVDHKTKEQWNIVKFLELYLGHDSKQIKRTVDTYTEKFFVEHVEIVSVKKEIKFPDYFVFLSDDHPLKDRAVKYLSERNLDIGFLESRGLGFCYDGAWFGRIIIPFMNPFLCYYVGRTWFDDVKPKYRNPQKAEVGIGKSELFYNENALLEKEIYLNEGPIDALSCGELGIASLGWKLSPIQKGKLIESDVEVINIIPDRGYYEKALQLGFELMEHKKVNITNLDTLNTGNDVNEVGFQNLNFFPVNYSLLIDSL